MAIEDKAELAAVGGAGLMGTGVARGFASSGHGADQLAKTTSTVLTEAAGRSAADV